MVLLGSSKKNSLDRKVSLEVCMLSHLHRRMTVRKHQSKVYNCRLSFSKSGVKI